MVSPNAAERLLAAAGHDLADDLPPVGRGAPAVADDVGAAQQCIDAVQVVGVVLDADVRADVHDQA